MTFDEWMSKQFWAECFVDDLPNFRTVWNAATKAEREACAKIAENFAWYNEESCSPDEQHEHIAQAIRSRGQTND